MPSSSQLSILPFKMRVLLILLLNTFHSLYAQKDTLNQSKTVLFADIGIGLSSGSQTPFWIRANQNGAIPLQSTYGLIRAGGKSLLEKRGSKTQWLIESEIVANIGKSTHLLLPVGNMSFRHRGLEIYVGRKKETFGLCDTILGSGSYIWSGNALPIPKVHIGTKGFVPMAFSRNFIAFQATFAHGWFGKQQFAYGYYLHQKTLYLRFGKPKNSLNIYTGLAHFAQWGGYAPWLVKFNRTGPNGELQGSFHNFLDVVLARNSVNSTNLSLNEPENQVGNHVGSIDIALAYRAKNSNWLLYYQHAIESRGILHNLPDGLFGLRWQSLKALYASRVQIKQITFEVLTTLDQNTSFDERLGLYYNDDYFNHPFQYYDGWNYNRRIIGTPFITLRNETHSKWFDVRGTYDSDAVQQVNNNRLIAYYLGIQGTLSPYSQFKIKLSSSLNYLYFDNSTGKYNQPVSQFSGYAEVNSKVKFLKKTYVSASFAYDYGNLFPTNFGIYLNLRQLFF